MNKKDYTMMKDFLYDINKQLNQKIDKLNIEFDLKNKKHENKKKDLLKNHTILQKIKREKDKEIRNQKKLLGKLKKRLKTKENEGEKIYSIIEKKDEKISNLKNIFFEEELNIDKIKFMEKVQLESQLFDKIKIADRLTLELSLTDSKCENLQKMMKKIKILKKKNKRSFKMNLKKKYLNFKEKKKKAISEQKKIQKLNKKLLEKKNTNNDKIKKPNFEQNNNEKIQKKLEENFSQLKPLCVNEVLFNSAINVSDISDFEKISGPKNNNISDLNSTSNSIYILSPKKHNKNKKNVSKFFFSHRNNIFDNFETIDRSEKKFSFQNENRNIFKDIKNVNELDILNNKKKIPEHLRNIFKNQKKIINNEINKIKIPMIEKKKEKNILINTEKLENSKNINKEMFFSKISTNSKKLVLSENKSLLSKKKQLHLTKCNQKIFDLTIKNKLKKKVKEEIFKKISKENFNDKSDRNVKKSKIENFTKIKIDKKDIFLKNQSRQNKNGINFFFECFTGFFTQFSKFDDYLN